jgi:cytochrome b561
MRNQEFPMADTKEKFSPLTIAFHWILGLTIVGLVAVGIWMTDLPKGEFRAWVYGWHKVIGTTVLMLAALRILWRWRNGMPQPAANSPAWQRQAAQAVHYLLLIATILMPVSGALYSYGGGFGVPVLGLFVIKSAEKIPWMYNTFKFVHGWAGWILAGIIVLHALAALHHHFVEKDGTLRRMLGTRIV